MRTFGHLLRLLLCLSVPAIVLGIPAKRPGACPSWCTTRSPADPPTQSVNVVNPLPLPVQGTVNVGNLPAAQQVSGTVSVDNFPATQAVSISGTPTVNANITNTTPLSIRDADNPARHPFQPAFSF
jgi:hypothetical protein